MALVTSEDKMKIRRQAERILFDIYYDKDLQWDGLFCRMEIGPFARVNGWRNWQVRRALYEAEKGKYIISLQVEYGKASFRLVPPPFITYIVAQGG